MELALFPPYLYLSHKKIQPLQSHCQSQSVLSRNPLPICVTKEMNLILCELRNMGQGWMPCKEIDFFCQTVFCKTKSKAIKLLWVSSKGGKTGPSPLHTLDFLSFCPCTHNSFKLICIISNNYLVLRNLTLLPDILFLFSAVVLPSLPSSIRM